MASRNSADLSPTCEALYHAFMQACEDDIFLTSQGITVLTTCTFRSNEEQEKLFAQGRTTPGAIVTKAHGGQSKHNRCRPNGDPAAEAFDVVPLQHGKPIWGTEGEDRAIWDHLGELGVGVGLDWYGLPDAPFREFPHFQNPGA